SRSAPRPRAHVRARAHATARARVRVFTGLDQRAAVRASARGSRRADGGCAAVHGGARLRGHLGWAGQARRAGGARTAPPRGASRCGSLRIGSALRRARARRRGDHAARRGLPRLPLRSGDLLRARQPLPRPGRLDRADHRARHRLSAAVMSELVEAIGRVVSALPDGALDALERAFGEGASASAVVEAVPTDAYRERARALVRAQEDAGVDGRAVGIAIAAARERERAARRQRVSVVWTGPETPAIAMRRTDQALLELIAMACRRLIVMSFAVYKVPEVAAALVAAAGRGCQVAIVLESEAESGGKVTYEMSQALGSEVAEHATLYTWPSDQRPEVGGGKRASLHAKCAVADGERLLVSSANLTEYAFT